MQKSALFVEKVKSVVRSVVLGIEIPVKTNEQGEIRQTVDLLELVYNEIASSTAGIEGETLTLEWLRENVSGDDLYSLVINDVEGPEGEWLGSDDAACTIVGPISTSVSIGNTNILVEGIEQYNIAKMKGVEVDEEDEESLGMSTMVLIRSSNAPLIEDAQFTLQAHVSVSLA